MINRYILFFLLFLFNLNLLKAHELNNKDCDLDKGVVIAFTNGVATDKLQSWINVLELKKLPINNSYNKNIQYELLYNTSEGLLKDLAETFNQRLLESGEVLAGRFELFFEAIQGGGTWIENIIEVVESAAKILTGFINYVRESIASFFTNLINLFKSNPTKNDYKEHDKDINKWINEDKKQIIFVAHSQGNLFANRTYKKIDLDNKEKNIQVVHVAPASIDLNGDYTLVDIDIVINAILRAVGSVRDINTIADKLTIKNTDKLGHGFIETYLNPEVKILNENEKFLVNKINNQLNIAFNKLCNKCREEWNWEFSHYEYDYYHPLIPPQRRPIYNYVKKTICN